MNSFLYNLLEAHALLAFLVILYRLLYPAYPDFRMNRWVLLSFPLIAGLGGFMSFAVGANTAVTFPTYNLRELAITGSDNSGASIQPWNMGPLALCIYSICVAGFLGKGLYHLWGLLRIVRQNPRYPDGDHTLVQVKGYPVFSFFHWLFWNPAIPTDAQKQNLIYQHELVHIQQWHSLDLLIAYVVKSFGWFNPAAYFLSNDIRLNLEYLADQTIIHQQHADVSAYGQTLMEQQLLNRANPFMNPFWNKQIQNRVHMLKQNRQAGRQQFVNGLVVALIGALTAGVVACTNNQEAPNDNPEGAEQNKTEQRETLSPNALDKQPEFKGGKKAFFKYLRENVAYPESLKEEGKTAKVRIAFVVAKDGSITNAEVEKAAEEEAFNKEALATVKAMPDWDPGKVDGEPARVQYRVPITFKPEN